jgi:hypothetical protein
VDSLPAPPVVAYGAGLFFEYAPTSDAHASDLIEGRPAPAEIAISARCVDCTGPTLTGKALRDKDLGPASAAHAGATIGYSAALTFPAVGTWRIDPFETLVTVRALDAFEPPLIHVRPWSDELPEGCNREDVAALLARFERAYNTGDPALLEGVVQQGINFSIAGGEQRFVATDRESFIRGVAARHAAGESIRFTEAGVASTNGAVNMSVNAIRSAPDLSGGRQRLIGKAAMWCTQPQFIHLNLGVV